MLSAVDASPPLWQPVNPVGNHKLLGSGGSMVARLKLKGIDGEAHKEWSLRLNLTQHGETHKSRKES